MANAFVPSVGKDAAAEGEESSFLAGNFTIYKSNNGFCAFVRCECNFNALLYFSLMSFTVKMGT